MSAHEQLWQRVLAALEAHCKPGVDRDAHAALERVTTKCLRISEPFRIDPSTCALREQNLSLASLHEQVVYHPRKYPLRLHVPEDVMLRQTNQRTASFLARFHSTLGDKGT